MSGTATAEVVNKVTAGIVYILWNPEMPGLVKIGRTKRTAEKRARELYTTGVPSPYVVLFDVFVDDPLAVEAAIHERFRHLRLPKREFFHISPKEAIHALLEVASPHGAASPYRGEWLDILQSLRDEFGQILHHDLRAVSLHHSHDSVVLRVTRQALSGDRTTIETDLGFIVDGEEPVFSVEHAVKENAGRLLALDELTLVMCTPLVREEEAHRIDREQNPYWTELWHAATDDQSPDHS